jgi:aquaporin Z
MGIALRFGLVALATIYTVGDISGAHLNHAVSLGFFAARRFSAKRDIGHDNVGRVPSAQDTTTEILLV